MEGFLSTSLEKDQALKNYQIWNKNTIVEVNVKVDGLGGELDWGFANITKCSNYYGQKEVLFNPINIFRVVDCREDEDIPDSEGGLAGINAEKVVVLEYGGFQELRIKAKKG